MSMGMYNNYNPYKSSHSSKKNVSSWTRAYVLANKWKFRPKPTIVNMEIEGKIIKHIPYEEAL